MERFPSDVVDSCPADRAARDLGSDSIVVGRPTRAALLSRRFNTRRETRVVESLDTYNQHRVNVMISTPV
jgi:hypothetical protein